MEIEQPLFAGENVEVVRCSCSSRGHSKSVVKVFNLVLPFKAEANESLFVHKNEDRISNKVEKGFFLYISYVM